MERDIIVALHCRWSDIVGRFLRIESMKRLFAFKNNKLSDELTLSLLMTSFNPNWTRVREKYHGPLSFWHRSSEICTCPPTVVARCNRALRHRRICVKYSQSGMLPLVHLERARERAQLRTCYMPHSTVYGAGQENDWNVDRHLVRLQTTVHQWFFRPLCTAEWKWRGGLMVLQPDYWCKRVKMYVKT
jgi:hypothetical protein